MPPVRRSRRGPRRGTELGPVLAVVAEGRRRMRALVVLEEADDGALAKT